MAPRPVDFFAPCPRGAEALLVTELKEIGATQITPAAGGVAFRGDTTVGWVANLCSRFAIRILQRVNLGKYNSTDDIYTLARQTPWELFHDHKASLRVDLTAIRSPLQSLQFATLRIKDGICDRYRELTGERPSIDTHRPERRVVAFLQDQQIQLYLDWSGEPLFKRGWRAQANDAPMKENLAATLLALAGWGPWLFKAPQPIPTQDGPYLTFFDPFCGSGTLAIEAACISAGELPGAQRRFAFESQIGFDSARWQSVRDKCINQARKAAQDFQRQFGEARIIASDIALPAILIAQQNARQAGLAAQTIEFKQSDALHWASPAPRGMMVTNPPYGERLDMKGRKVLTSEAKFWPLFGDLLKKQFSGWQAWLFTADLELPGQIRLKPKRRTPLYNGPIECRLFGFDLYQGSMRRPGAST